MSQKLRVAVFDIHDFERGYLEEANKKHGYTVSYLDARLNEDTVSLAFGQDVVCVFESDLISERVLNALHVARVRLVALRCPSFRNVDLEAAAKYGIPVVHVPEYSAHAVAEHATALILALDRNLIKGHARVQTGDFALDGLAGFDLFGKTIGIIGTGHIGSILAKIMRGFGCCVLAHDLCRDENLISQYQVSYVDLPELYAQSDIISLHLPLTPETKHLLNSRAFSMMKKGVMIINTGRGALIDTEALIDALKSGQVGMAGLDVYEEEENVVFQDLSNQVLQDDMLARLLTFPNVMITAHQGFLTKESLRHVANVTFQNISDFEAGRPLVNLVSAKEVLRKAA